MLSISRTISVGFDEMIVMDDGETAVYSMIFFPKALIRMVELLVIGMTNEKSGKDFAIGECTWMKG